MIRDKPAPREGRRGQGRPSPGALSAWPHWEPFPPTPHALRGTLNLFTSLLRLGGLGALGDQSRPQGRGRISAGPQSWSGPARLSPPASCITASSHIGVCTHTHTCAHVHSTHRDSRFARAPCSEPVKPRSHPRPFHARVASLQTLLPHPAASPTPPRPPPLTPPSFLSWSVPRRLRGLLLRGAFPDLLRQGQGPGSHALRAALSTPKRTHRSLCWPAWPQSVVPLSCLVHVQALPRGAGPGAHRNA